MTYYLKQSESRERVDQLELAIIRNRRAIKRFKIKQALATRIFKTIAISSILGISFFGLGALVCWKLEMNNQGIATINNSQNWQTRKHICLSWMLISFSSFVSTTSFTHKFQQQ